MAEPFVKTQRVLRQEASTVNLLLVVAGLLLLLAWLLMAVALPLSQTISSVGGRVVSALEPTRIVANSEQPISAMPVRLGDVVRRGQRLVLFDQRDLMFEQQQMRDAVQESQQRLTAVQAEMGFVRKEYDSRIALLGSSSQRIAARVQQIEARIDFSQVAVQIYRDLRSERQIDELKFREAQANLKQEQQQLAALTIEAAEVQARRERAEQEWRAATARLQGEISRIQGQLNQRQTQLDQVDHRISRMELVAPHDGVVEGQASLSIGQTVPRNTWLMTISPLGDFRFEARFRATEAAGRITPGALARIHFTALPWTEFGMLPASVLRVGNEEIEGLVTVVFRFDQTQQLAGYAHHGLTGQAIVEVDEITLLQRLLRLLT